jgi:hypothetical protein
MQAYQHYQNSQVKQFTICWECGRVGERRSSLHKRFMIRSSDVFSVLIYFYFIPEIITLTEKYGICYSKTRPGAVTCREP